MQSLFAISGRRRLELFGEDHNIRPGWVTVGTHLTSSNFNPQVGYPTWSLLTCVEHTHRTEQNRTEQNRTEQNRTEQNRTEQEENEKKGTEKKRLDKKEKNRNEQKRKEKSRKDYTFRRHFNEKPSIIPGCPGHKHTQKPPHCYSPH